jgi:hypothetical protein
MLFVVKFILNYYSAVQRSVKSLLPTLTETQHYIVYDTCGGCSFILRCAGGL